MQPATPWYLFHLTDYYEESQLSITMDPRQHVLELALPDVDGNLQRVAFRHSSLFDRRWHKIMLGVSQDKATLWVDCQPVFGIRGDLIEPLEPRGQFDATGGHLYVSRLVDVPVTVPVCI